MGHKLDDRVLITPALLRRFDAEAESETRYQATIITKDGNVIRHGMGPQADPVQSMILTDLLHLLNREISHDGAWCGLLVLPGADGVYSKMTLLWLDGDGDVRVPIEIEEPIHVVAMAGPAHWVEQCEIAWRLWKTMMVEVLDPSEGQTFKRALGEAAPSTTH